MNELTDNQNSNNGHSLYIHIREPSDYSEGIRQTSSICNTNNKSYSNGSPATPGLCVPLPFLEKHTDYIKEKYPLDALELKLLRLTKQYIALEKPPLDFSIVGEMHHLLQLKRIRESDFHSDVYKVFRKVPRALELYNWHKNLIHFLGYLSIRWEILKPLDLAYRKPIESSNRLKDHRVFSLDTFWFLYNIEKPPLDALFNDFNSALAKSTNDALVKVSKKFLQLNEDVASDINITENPARHKKTSKVLPSDQLETEKDKDDDDSLPTRTYKNAKFITNSNEYHKLKLPSLLRQVFKKFRNVQLQRDLMEFANLYRAFEHSMLLVIQDH